MQTKLIDLSRILNGNMTVYPGTVPPEFNVLKRIENYKFWQDGNHAEIIFSNNFFYQKLDYIHKNPVEEMIVSNPEDYYFSSARNYAGMDSFIPVVLG